MILAVSTVEVVAVAAVLIVALIALIYLLLAGVGNGPERRFANRFVKPRPTA
jgi:hypothetical protein